MVNAQKSAVGMVLVTHNSARDIPDLFASWQSALLAAGREFSDVPIIVVDSDSTDNTLGEVEENAPHAIIMALANNGFGAAANAGMAACATPWALLCNSDLIFKESFGRFLLAPLESGTPPHPVDEHTAVVGPRLLNTDGTLQFSAGRFPSVRGLLADRFRARPERKYLPRQPAAPAIVDWCTAACVLIRRDAFDHAGGFDPAYFLYVEEVDLQYRLARLGYRCVYVPAAEVAHVAPNAARPARARADVWAARGVLRYFAKHGTTAQLRAYGALACASGRLSFAEAFAGRAAILAKPTGP